MEAIADPPAYHRARAAVRYDEMSRALVHALKYGDRLDLAPMMGRWMAVPAASCWPRPTRWSRCRCIGAGCGRGASTNRPRWPRAVSAASGVPVAARRAQARASHRRSRSGCREPNAPTNVQGAFRVPAEGKAEVAGPPAGAGRRRVDLRRHRRTCARALLRAGAANVDVLVFARVAEPGPHVPYKGLI